MQKLKVCVVGAGVVGLSCALKIQEEYRDSIQITVIADAFLDETTSCGSGGLWEPYQIAGTSDLKINQWGKHSFEHFSQLYQSKDAAAAGVQLVTCYQLLESNEKFSLPGWKDIVLNFSELSTDEIRKLNLPARFTKGFTFGTYVVDQKYYLRYLTDKLESSGVTFVRRKLSSLEELRSDATGPSGTGYDLVINCAGLGSAALVADKEMYPIRGQVLRVRYSCTKPQRQQRATLPDFQSVLHL
jgi:D-amino-acid oxidase